MSNVSIHSFFVSSFSSIVVFFGWYLFDNFSIISVYFLCNSIIICFFFYIISCRGFACLAYFTIMIIFYVNLTSIYLIYLCFVSNLWSFLKSIINIFGYSKLVFYVYGLFIIEIVAVVILVFTAILLDFVLFLFVSYLFSLFVYVVVNISLWWFCIYFSIVSVSLFYSDIVGQVIDIFFWFIIVIL